MDCLRWYGPLCEGEAALLAHPSVEASMRKGLKAPCASTVVPREHLMQKTRTRKKGQSTHNHA